MRKYEQAHKAPRPATPEEFLRSPNTQLFLPAFSQFYNQFGQEQPDQSIVREIDGKDIDFSILESLVITRSLQRSVLALRKNQPSTYQETEYRLFKFNFQSAPAQPTGSIEEFAFLGGEFNGSRSVTTPFPVFTHTHFFHREGDEFDPEHSVRTLELSSDSRTPSRWIEGGEEYLLDDIRRVEIPAYDTTLRSYPAGQLALRHMVSVPRPIAS